MISPANMNFIVLVLLLGVVGVLGYESTEKRQEYAALSGDIERLQAEQRTTSKQLSAALASLETNLTVTKSEQENLRSDLQSEKQKSGVLASQLGQVSGVVSTLEKLTNTDEELLQKYSKVYFLNENYIPARLSRIEPAYMYDVKTPKRDLQIHTSVWPHLKDVIDAADKAVGNDLLVISAYRSFGTQEELKSQYVTTYGAGTANRFSADQGYSEHQLGTTVDFTTAKTGVDWNMFETIAVFAWLTKNAHTYGFTLSYPKTNTYYTYEPWHWRFVGKEFATHLYNEGKHFYDIDQREIDKYLVSIFD